MLKRALRTAFLTIALAASGPALGDEISDGVATLPGAIEDVRIGGTWETDEQSGVYRVLIARTGGNAVVARLFVQWVAYFSDGGARLLDTIEITEWAELEIDIVDYISESDQDGLTLYIQADNPSADGDESFELFVFSPQEYIFGPASN